MKIPKLTNERLAELQATIKPVIRDGKDLWYIEDVDPRNIAFTWDPKPTEKATGLKLLCTARTLHTYGYHGFFKPSIAEVLAQVPADLVDKAVAFEVNGPGTADDLNQEKEALDAGFHVAQTSFYASEGTTTTPTIWDRLIADEKP